jgi:hypothetical protein
VKLNLRRYGEGKPKVTGLDNFDRLLRYRDDRLKDEGKVR